MEMDPVESEDLVAALFRAMGMEVMTTERTGTAAWTCRPWTPSAAGNWSSTAEFGPSAQEFAAGKPLTLIGGRELASLLPTCTDE
jgi:hypothetical protein